MKKIKIISVIVSLIFVFCVFFACGKEEEQPQDDINTPKQGTKAVENGVTDTVAYLTGNFVTPDIEGLFNVANGGKYVKEEYSGNTIEDNTKIAKTADNLPGFLKDLQICASEARINALRSVNNTIGLSVALNKWVEYSVPEGVENLADRNTVYRLDFVDNESIKEYKYTFFKRIYASETSTTYTYEARYISISTDKATGLTAYTAQNGYDFFYKYIPEYSLTVISGGVLREMKIVEENGGKTVLAYEYSSHKPEDIKRYERITRIFYGNKDDGYYDANDSDALLGTALSYYKDGKLLWRYNNAESLTINLACFNNWKNAALNEKVTDYIFMTDTLSDSENGSADYGFSSVFYSNPDRLISFFNNLDLEFLDAENTEYTTNQKILRIKESAYTESKFDADIYAVFSGSDSMNITVNGISSIRDIEKVKKNLGELVTYMNLSWAGGLNENSIFNAISLSLRTITANSDSRYNSMAVAASKLLPGFFKKWGINPDASAYRLESTVDDGEETVINDVKTIFDGIISSYFTMSTASLDSIFIQSENVSRFDYGGEIIPITKNNYYNFTTSIDYVADLSNYAVTKADFIITLPANYRPSRSMFGLSESAGFIYEFYYYDIIKGTEKVLKTVVAEDAGALTVKLGINDFKNLNLTESGTYYLAVRLKSDGKVLGVPVDLQLGKDSGANRLLRYNLTDATNAEKLNVIVNFYSIKTAIEVYKA